ncbi:hypothetical protein [Xanthobacter aminoxidans]|uniref:hypothetical protein n=1 Tax=Xanthobacter aminoxidans TaxID=186280 RepID=UPI002023080E|nr:hypothetical protein [Xanthobacter aminoxidans]MCL8385542.1 hypothetical protein [Xanthobacter aminoxidans]
MKAPRRICPACGSIKVDVGPKATRCLNCGHVARKFPSSLAPVASPEKWDGRDRAFGHVLPAKGAE